MQANRMCSRFAQSVGAGLRNVLSAVRLEQAVMEESQRWRERSYGPLQNLELFIEQVLSADHSCQDAVARAASARVGRGEARGSLSSGPYCKARQRLSLSLVHRLGQEVGQVLCECEPREWRWRGREVRLVDGTTLWMPDTAENQACYPQNRAQRSVLYRLVQEHLATWLALREEDPGCLFRSPMVLAHDEQSDRRLERGILSATEQVIEPANAGRQTRTPAGARIKSIRESHDISVGPWADDKTTRACDVRALKQAFH